MKLKCQPIMLSWSMTKSGSKFVTDREADKFLTHYMGWWVFFSLDEICYLPTCFACRGDYFSYLCNSWERPITFRNHNYLTCFVNFFGKNVAALKIAQSSREEILTTVSFKVIANWHEHNIPINRP